eukprot:TRINITY_DN10037_c0_g1_i1.p2 TRINITY_DN10037_c0_g1~~TRINITY_DN10037_c0_g1_i1.p2  ORF type:complete len:380 (+),score=31.83 TRINITY_DN10037_c0_g1_i1:1829-2968(+)
MASYSFSYSTNGAGASFTTFTSTGPQFHPSHGNHHHDTAQGQGRVLGQRDGRLIANLVVNVVTGLSLSRLASSDGGEVEYSLQAHQPFVVQYSGPTLQLAPGGVVQEHRIPTTTVVRISTIVASGTAAIDFIDPTALDLNHITLTASGTSSIGLTSGRMPVQSITINLSDCATVSGVIVAIAATVNTRGASTISGLHALQCLVLSSHDASTVRATHEPGAAVQQSRFGTPTLSVSALARGSSPLHHQTRTQNTQDWASAPPGSQHRHHQAVQLHTQLASSLQAGQSLNAYNHDQGRVPRSSALNARGVTYHYPVPAEEEELTSDQVEVKKECTICMMREVRTVILPCFHNILCVTCARKRMESCPMCRTPIQEVKRVYG